MQPPKLPPTSHTLNEWRTFALEFVRGHFREYAPPELTGGRVFARSPLEGEGAAAVFSFSSGRGNSGPQPYYVIVGETEPNYYPEQGLDVEDAYCLHLGTRFMLVMGIAQVPPGQPDDSGYDAARDARMVVDRVAPDRVLSDVAIAATFDVGGEMHTVLRCSIDNQPVYVFGRDAPNGFSTRVDLAPQVVFRIHLGRVLLAEPDPAGPKRAD